MGDIIRFESVKGTVVSARAGTELHAAFDGSKAYRKLDDEDPGAVPEPAEEPAEGEPAAEAEEPAEPEKPAAKRSAGRRS